VGNIIKNEVLWRVRIHPQTKVKNITASELQALIAETKKFSLLFYRWRKVFLLRKHLDIYQKSICPRCGANVKREKTGKRMRISHFCPVCQIRMTKIAEPAISPPETTPNGSNPEKGPPF
jgi:endonuclease-8